MWRCLDSFCFLNFEGEVMQMPSLWEEPGWQQRDWSPLWSMFSMFPSLVNAPLTQHGLNNECPSLIPTSSCPQRLHWDRQPGLQLVLAKTKGGNLSVLGSKISKATHFMSTEALARPLNLLLQIKLLHFQFHWKMQWNQTLIGGNDTFLCEFQGHKLNGVF